MKELELSAAQEEILRRYARAVTTAPHRLSLTATRDAEAFWKRHVLDALSLAKQVVAYSPPVFSAIDVGSGNGVPGIPLAVFFQDSRFILLDSDNKKVGFLETFLIVNAIKNCTVMAVRAEEFAHTLYREKFDIAFARALSKLPVALELASAFVKVGGVLIVPHGTTGPQELAACKKAMKELNLEIDLQTQSSVIIFKKIAPCMQKYPRAIGIPKKRPL